MKKLFLSLCILSLSSLSCAETHNAWETVNSVTSPVQALWIWALGSDNKGNLYQLGSLYNTGLGSWLVRKSSDGGYTWNAVDTALNGAAWGFASDSQGNIYVAGKTYGQFPEDSDWLIRKSSDSGSTWSDLDNFQKGEVFAISIAPNGDIYTGGMDFNVIGLVRKSSDGGKTWNTVDHLDQTGCVTAMTIDSKGNVYEAGYLTPSLNQWFVRMSADNGATWTTVDTFTFGNSLYPTAAAADADGNIYVIGYGATPDSKNASITTEHWLVRKGNKNGTWTTVDDFIYPNTIDSEAYAITIDKNGVIFVAGGSQIGMNGIVRMSMNGGATWSTMDDFQTPSRTNYRLCFHGIQYDSQGHLYTVATGQTFDSTPWHIVTRKFFGVGEGFKK